jgi:hypothetical protein
MPAEKFDFRNAQGHTLAALLDRPDGAVRPGRRALRGPLRGHLRVTGMARWHLDNCCYGAFIPRIVFRARRAHDTPACGKSASGREIFRSWGRPTSRPVERREAQRPISGLRKPVGRLAPRLASGRRNPVRQARDPGASQAPARGLASPWRLPALHSLSERKQGTGDPAPAHQQGRRSVG